MGEKMKFEEIIKLKIVTAPILEAIALIQDFIKVPPRKNCDERKIFEYLNEVVEKMVAFETNDEKIFVDNQNGNGLQELSSELRNEIVVLVKEELQRCYLRKQ